MNISTPKIPYCNQTWLAGQSLNGGFELEKSLISMVPWSLFAMSGGTLHPRPVQLEQSHPATSGAISRNVQEVCGFILHPFAKS